MTDRPLHLEARFQDAHSFQQDILALPITDLDATSHWYSQHFGMTEVERFEQPVPTVILERDGIKVGFEKNGGDASQDGAAILVASIAVLREELEAKGVQTGHWRVDEREGEKFQVFFVVAPDALCYCFYEPIAKVVGKPPRKPRRPKRKPRKPRTPKI